MAVVDRNVLRMAVYEILYRIDIPTSVTINEAIEIAKKYGTDESGSFVNGILDRAARLTGKLDEAKMIQIGRLRPSKRRSTAMTRRPSCCKGPFPSK